MSSLEQYPFAHHPCFAESRKELWARIHLPVAQHCNVKCIFCDQSIGSSCHTSKPGFANSLMEPQDAISRAMEEVENDSSLRIIAISGPGEPLANEETFTTLEGIRKQNESLNFCLSTNGVLLEDCVPRLLELGVTSISVSVNAIFPETAASIYDWARIDGKVTRGKEMGRIVIKKQFAGIKRAAALGMIIKVNTILIPGINTNDIDYLSKEVANFGASLQNIVPLIPCGKNLGLRSPTANELGCARLTGSKHIRQFTQCKQCRSDVVGIPGKDRIL
ncbi:radical SAM protein [Candidatus Thorarchaeota archaeon]|nr:radical SAM protein [Candidatus Thorarchaeota archaeon]TFG97936.1 MAG: radical SAM protein [Candidatus Thorarchaeota archaeon]